jgi:predicted ArsR family transcriptional regulator
MNAIQQYPLESDLIKETYKKLGVESGEHIFKQIELENQLKTWSLKDIEQFYIAKYLEESGYEPEIMEIDSDKIVYRVHNCVVFELAEMWPNIICDVFHEGIHEGLANVTGGKMKIIRTKCMANAAPYCEFICEWL